MEELNRLIRGLTFTPIVPSAVKRGDHVTVELTTHVSGYVDSINPDGTFNISERRTAFPGESPVKVAICRPGSVINRTPAPRPRVKVGDVIDGATVRATPWKRGTIITFIDGGRQRSRVMVGDGTWRDLGDGRTVSFTHFNASGEVYRVDYAPGK